MRTPYSTEFFVDIDRGSTASADVIVPHVLSLFEVRSVVDVGCGLGSWLTAFERNGVTDYLGVDSHHVPLGELKVPVERFQRVDLTKRLSLHRTFNLACSLEVAEHLPRECAAEFVGDLIKAASVVLFSAAIPRQGGTAHLNEQWPWYWAALFRHHGYIAVDCVRPLIFNDARVDWWYRQNIIVFCRPEKRPGDFNPATTPYELDRIDPGLIQQMHAAPRSGSEALKVLRDAVRRRLRPRSLVAGWRTDTRRA